MASDPELLGSLERALAADPAERSLRLHLIGLLLADELFGRALGHSEAGLQLDPADEDLRRLQATALAGLGVPGAAAPVGVAGEVDAPPVEGERIPSADELYEMTRPAITLDSVAGLEAAKQVLRSTVLAPMQNPELRDAFGLTMRGGLLMYGPPGCGKTFLAKALAGEMGLYFLSIGLSEVLDMWVGNSEKNISAVFEQARQNQPTLLFIDELDALGHRRQELVGSGLRNAVAQLLVELDGHDRNNDGIFVLGATNQPWSVDVALRRPGRFDRSIAVLPPDETARVQILEASLSKVPHDRIDARSIAARTDMWSGADLVLLCRTAVEQAMIDSAARTEIRGVTQRDLEDALAGMRPSTTEWLRTARGHAQLDSSGTYREVSDYLRKRKP